MTNNNWFESKIQNFSQGLLNLTIKLKFSWEHVKKMETGFFSSL